MPITPPTLTIADAADGTGGTATLTGGPAGATNTLSLLDVTLGLQSDAWATDGSRTGPGTIVVTATPGLYWAKVESVDGADSATSNLVYVAFTNGVSPMMERGLLAVRAKILALALPDISAANVRIHKVPAEENVPKPCILIAPVERETADPRAGTNNRDDIVYPIFVGIVDVENRDQTTDRSLRLTWRDRIVRAFQNARLAGTEPQGSHTTVDPREILLPEGWSRNLFASAVVVRLIARETRV